MSLKKNLLGIILILSVFSILLVFLFPSLYSNNPAGRFTKEVQVDFEFLQNESKPVVLLFFGYAGCADICPPALMELSQIYNQLDQNKVAFYFVNLQHKNHVEEVKHFAQAFNEKFIGIYLNYDQIMEAVRKLKFVYLPSGINQGVIDHSGYLHLFIKDPTGYKQKFLYTSRPFNKEYIVQDIQQILKRKQIL